MRTKYDAQLGKRITQIRGDRSRPEFAAEMGVHKNTLIRYEDAQTSVNADFIAKLASLGYNAHWILTGEGSMHIDRSAIGLAEPQTSYEASEFVDIPLYDVEASAGHGSAVLDEEIAGRYAFRRDFVRSKGWRVEDLVLIWGRGDSMPGVIEDGQLVLVNLAQNTITDEGIYVLRLDEHLVIKTVQRGVHGEIYIRSTNPRYREITVPKEELDDLEVVGRAVWTDSLL